MRDVTDSAQEIFFAAIDLDSPEARERYVAERCRGNLALQDRVNQLLAAHCKVGNFLEGEQPTEGTLVMPAVNTALPEEVGAYRLREQIGEGGFGVVFVAEQISPVQRKVALKILKPGMDTKEVIARFNAERQALAMMDHPNIARVFDAGTTELGRPYFVMELVRGVPITEYCDEAAVDTPGRLRMFIDICQAVQHAHLKGIIHRDLKPSNVMVTLYDGEPVIKVIDFGIAKAIDQRLTDLTIYTRYHQLLGTPMYMSPEQAEHSGLDVDTRSDVYSLGVLLYVLLTGATPFDEETMKRAGLDGMRRIIRENEPPRPSVRVSTLRGEARETVSRCRRLEPRQLTQHLRGELDWIVMKAIEKDRNRRYESASALAADVERYLQGEPVEACPPTTAYRLQKYARRHAAALVTAAVVGISLIAGTAVSVWQAVEATVSREQAEANLRDAERQRRQAEQNLRLAQDAMDRLKRERELANKARRIAEQNELKSRQLLYASDLRRAIEALHDKDLALGIDRLQSHVPDDDELDLRDSLWHLVHASLHPTPSMSFDHGAPVTDCAVTPDGKMLVTSAADGQLRMWSLSKGNLLRVIRAHDKAARSIALSPSGDSLVSGGDDDLVKVWDVATCRQLRTLGAMRTGVETVAWSPDGKWIAAGSRYSEFRVWSNDGEQVLQVDSDQRHEALAFSPDGKLLYVPTRTHLEAWSTETWKKSAQLSTGTLVNVRSMAFADGGRRLLVGDRFGNAFAVLDTRSGTLLNYVKSRVEYPQCLAISHSGERLAYVARDGSLRMIRGVAKFSAPSPITVTVQAHEGPAYEACFWGDSTLFTAGEDGLVKRWRCEQLEAYWREIPMEGNSVGVDCCDTPNRVLLSPSLKLARPVEFDLVLGKKVGSDAEAARYRAGIAAAFSSRGRWAAVGGLDGELAIWDLKTKRIAAELSGMSKGAIHMAFAPDGKALAACDMTEQIVVWRTESDWTVRPVPAPQRIRLPDPRCVEFSPDGNLLAATGFSPVHLSIWDVERNERIVEVLHDSIDDRLAWSLDGKGVAVVCEDGRIRVWSAQDGELLYETAIYPTRPSSLAFAPDGRTLLSGHAGGAIRAWHIPSAQSLGALYQSRHADDDVCFIDFDRLNRILAIVARGDSRFLVVNTVPTAGVATEK